MTTNESPRAANTGAFDQQNASPQRSNRKFTSINAVSTAEKIMEATEQAHYLRSLADLLGRTTYRGCTVDGDLYYSVDDDPTGRIDLTRAGLRPLCPPTLNRTLDRLRLGLIGHAAKLQIELDDLAINAPRGLTGADLQHALNALVTTRTVDLIGRTTEDADDADRRLHALRHHLGGPARRYPAGGAR